jgi:two-component system response regulator HydG
MTELPTPVQPDDNPGPEFPVAVPGMRVLFVDDDPEMRALLRDVLSEQGYEVDDAPGGEEALKLLAKSGYDLLITDLRMGGIDGMALLQEARKLYPSLVVLVITAFGTIDSAVEAMKRGAFHFVTKPFKMAEFLVTVEKALEVSRLQQENQRLRQEVERRYSFGRLVGQSKEMQELFGLIERVARVNDHVIIIGESGTGKELVAKALHYNSPRRDKPFLAVNCSSLPRELLESELFGHVRGAFTGAVTSKRGLFEVASGGTLFLDEIGEMDKGLQAKLLRVLEDHTIRPVGATSEIKIDVRVVTATHRDLPEEVSKGNFREDLFYRLNVIRLKLPPLRQRLEDIPLLVDHFLERIAAESGEPKMSLSPKAREALLRHPWPGNVRELENALKRAALMADGERIEAEDLDLLAGKPVVTGLEQLYANRISLPELERRYIEFVLQQTGSNKTQAAEILGVSTRTLYRHERELAKPEEADSTADRSAPSD